MGTVFLINNNPTTLLRDFDATLSNDLMNTKSRYSSLVSGALQNVLHTELLMDLLTGLN